MQINNIRGLNLKKNRVSTQLFVAEGHKIIHSLICSTYKINTLYTTDPSEFESLSLSKIIPISQKELNKISFLKAPNKSLALVEIPKKTFSYKKTDVMLVLDRIRDPGNLGTIIRSCDWFGIKTIICSKDSVDCYNTKVIQATMGAIANVRIFYEDLEPLLKSYPKNIYGASLSGQNIYKKPFFTKEGCIILVGNEANGIKNSLLQYISQAINIPKHNSCGSESLNLSVATSIVLSEIFKQTNY